MTTLAAPADARTRAVDLRSLAFLLIFLAATVPVIAAPVLPLIDYYSHIARYFVLAHVGDDAFLTQLYEPRWAILPNIGIDVIGTTLMRFLPPLVVAKVIVLLIFTTQYFGLLALSRQLNGRISLMTAILTVPLLYSFILTWGFANFLLGLGLVFWAAAWWLWQRHRPVVAIPVACVLAVMIFFCHGVAFMLYGMLVGSLELGLFCQSKPRRIGALVRSMAGLAAQAVIPAILFMMSPTVAAPQGITNADESVRKLEAAGRLAHRIHDLIVYRATTIFRVAESPWAWLDLATFVVFLASLGFLIWRRKVAINPVAWPALGIGLVLVAIVPPDMFGVGYIADRMPLYVAFVLVAALIVKPVQGDVERACMSGIAALVAVRLLATGIGWQAYAPDLASLRNLLHAIPAHSLIAYVNAANDGRAKEAARCEMFGPLVVPLGADAAPLFAYASQQPIRLKGRVKRASEATATPPTDEPVEVKAAHRLALIAKTPAFDYALVCAPNELAGPIPASMRLVARDGRLAVFSVAKPAP